MADFVADSNPVLLDPERIAKLLDSYIDKAEAAFRTRIQNAGVILTGEMLNSFRQYAAEKGEGYVQAKLTMVNYTRIKDLRSMSYSRLPPLDALEYFVETVGVGRFAYVPGYPTKNLVRPVSETAAIERIAWGIRQNLRKYPNLKRGYRGIYSDPLLTEVLPNLFRDLTDDTRRTAILGVKLLFTQN